VHTVRRNAWRNSPEFGKTRAIRPPPPPPAPRGGRSRCGPPGLGARRASVARPRQRPGRRARPSRSAPCRAAQDVRSVWGGAGPLIADRHRARRPSSAWHAEKDHGRHGDIPGVGMLSPTAADAGAPGVALTRPLVTSWGASGWGPRPLSPLVHPSALPTTVEGLEERSFAQSGRRVPLRSRRSVTSDRGGAVRSAIGAGREVEEAPTSGTARCRPRDGSPPLGVPHQRAFAAAARPSIRQARRTARPSRSPEQVAFRPGSRGPSCSPPSKSR